MRSSESPSATFTKVVSTTPSERRISSSTLPMAACGVSTVRTSRLERGIEKLNSNVVPMRT